jgi:UPF0716 family protein affecting phage T7 exclusion
MNLHWKEFGERALHPRKWSGMAWTVVLMVILCSVATAVVGVKLVRMADRQTVSFSTK